MSSKDEASALWRKGRGISAVVSSVRGKAVAAKRQLSPGGRLHSRAAEPGGASWRRHNFSHFQSLRPTNLPRQAGEKLESKCGWAEQACIPSFSTLVDILILYNSPNKDTFQQSLLWVTPASSYFKYQTTLHANHTTLCIGESLSAHLQSHASFNN